jgi:S-adenosylmethionine-diacylglycerol 3-amino-3-carboxypropyl transferase
MRDIDYNTQVKAANLLKHAVYGQKEEEKVSLLDKIFALWFQRLVYPQIWEDPRVDIEAMSPLGGLNIITISSGGCNVLSYLTEGPHSITAVDLNHAHCALLKMKLAAIRGFETHQQFYDFFGHADKKTNKGLYEKFIAPQLEGTSRAYWETLVWNGKRYNAFSKNFYKYGLLGNLIGLLHCAARLAGTDLHELTHCKTIAEQETWFDAKVAPIFERPFVRRLVSSPMALFNLGIPPHQYKALCDGQSDRMADVLKQRARKIATVTNIKDNYFAWQAYARSYDHTPDGACPPYLRAENWVRLKQYSNRVEVRHSSYRDVLLDKPDRSLDRYVLLDAQDWMSDQELNLLWVQITRTASNDARVIFRTAGEKSCLIGKLAPEIERQWKRDDAASANYHAKDRSAIYGGFHLYRRITDGQ